MDYTKLRTGRRRHIVAPNPDYTRCGRKPFDAFSRVKFPVCKKCARSEGRSRFWRWFLNRGLQEQDVERLLGVSDLRAECKRRSQWSHPTDVYNGLISQL